MCAKECVSAVVRVCDVVNVGSVRICCAVFACGVSVLGACELSVVHTVLQFLKFVEDMLIQFATVTLLYIA